MLGIARHELDDVCLVIDMECFRVNNVYQCRELGYCSWRGDSGRVAVKPAKPLNRLTPRERQQAHFLTREIHGLFYTVDKRENAIFSVTCFMKQLYDEFATQDRQRVAFKGGRIELDLLNYLGMPYLDLETLGCPKYDQLRQHGKQEQTCGWHAIPNKHHCAMAECIAFFDWYRDYMQTPMNID